MIKNLFSRVREYKKSAMITPVFMVGEVAMEVLIPTLMALIIDNGVEKGNISYVVVSALILLLCALLSLFFGAAGAKTASRASAGFATNLRNDVYSKIEDMSFSDIDKFSTSSLITRLTTDIQSIQQSFQMCIRILFRAPVMFIFALLMVIKNGASMIAIFAVAIPLVVFTILIIFNLTRRYFDNAFKAYDKFNMTVQENLGGIRTVKAYVREDEEKKKFKKSADEIKYNFEHGQKIMAASMPAVQLIIYSSIIAISYLGAKLINNGSMQTGELMSIYTYAAQILSSLVMSGMIVIMFSMSFPAMKRVNEVLLYQPTMDKNEDGVKTVEDGSVEFDHVNFGYSASSSVLKDINLKIESGKMVGILGTTGSGKSTLISLIARLYDVNDGCVKVGGLNVKDYNLTSLRDSVSIVLQKNQLFFGTVADNLRWGDENATEEEMKNALRIASADFIFDGKDGLESRVEQGGANFSGGQRQRLCIARALMKKPKILILDDSTSAVDTATDRSIRVALKNDVNNLTKIIISQRISSIEDADMIIMMDNGKIDDIGTHEELLERNESYKNLYETQAKGASING